jgi:hypothetical protein
MLSSLATPVEILVQPGTYMEDNSSGPLTITAEGISLRGESSLGTPLKYLVLRIIKP